MRQVNQMKLGFAIILGVAIIAGYGGMCSTSSDSSDSGSSVATDAKGVTDTAFGTAGVVTSTIGPNSYAWAVALQADGKILAGGYGNDASPDHFALARYTSTGAPDTTFSADGVLTTTIGDNSRIRKIAVQSDGRIVAAGYSYDGFVYNATLACYTTTGAADLTFGGGDGVITAIFGTETVIYTMALEPDGDILIGGYATYGGTPCFALARYNITGTLDAGFGNNGVVTTTIGLSASVYGLGFQADGKIIAGGYSNESSDETFALARYTSAGVLDTGFGGGDGVITQTISGITGGSGEDDAYAMVIQPDGKILLAGYSYDGSSDYFGALARFTSTGALDTGFGIGGVMTATLPTYTDIEYYGIALQSNGKILVAGYGDNGCSEWFLARYNTNGALDTTFGGGDGIALFKIGTSGYAYGLAVQPDGKILLCGYEFDPADTNNHFCLFRVK